jgi:hypothetical protein
VTLSSATTPANSHSGDQRRLTSCAVTTRLSVRHTARAAVARDRSEPCVSSNVTRPWVFSATQPAARWRVDSSDSHQTTPPRASRSTSTPTSAPLSQRWRDRALVRKAAMRGAICTR